MTTMTTTNAGAVTRKLTALGFEKFSHMGSIGFDVFTMSDGRIHIANHTVADYPGTAAKALEDAGYIIEGHSYTDYSNIGRLVEVFFVVGRVAA
jgi:hypothetical protein